jgi:enoyl-CoA hydratase/carnithine racemase
VEIVLSRPPVNELSEELLDDLDDALDSVPERTRALVITSEVERVFMAGGDLRLMQSAPYDRLAAYVRRLQGTFTRLERLPLPVVVGIDGACLGGGLELALACDVKIASPTVRLGLPEVTLGLIAGAGGTQRLVRSIGQGPARDLLLTGRSVEAAEAKEMGLVTRLVADRSAAAAARETAAGLIKAAPEAIQASKRLALAAPDNSIASGLDQEWSEWLRVRRSPNSTEGLSAFLEKREADFE